MFGGEEEGGGGSHRLNNIYEIEFILDGEGVQGGRTYSHTITVIFTLGITAFYTF